MGAPQTLPADFQGWDKAPATLPADFDKWDQPKQETQQPSAASRLGTNFLSGIGVTSNEQAKHFFVHPLDTVIKSFEAQGELAKKAKEAYDRGDYMAALQHGLNYMVPFIGQQTDQAGTQLKEGDIAGGVGRTLGAAVPIIAGSPKVQAVASDVASAAAARGAQAIRASARGANVALAKAPGTIGGAAGAAAGGYLGGHVGAEVGGVAGAMAGRELLPQVRIPGEGFGLPNRVFGGPASAPPYTGTFPGAPYPEHPGIFPGAPLPEHPGVFPGAPYPGNPGVFPGAPLPETPPPGLLQASSLARGPQPVVDPAQGLGSIPVSKGSLQQAAAELGTKTPLPTIRARALEIQQQLNKSLGAQELKPNVPLREQLTAKPPEAPKLPEGFTPVDSSALKGFKYDPATKEFETITQGGQRYIHGDVSPEDAQAFSNADSKGKAWQQIRENPLVAKVINGKRVAIKPTSPAGASPNDLTQILQESLQQALSKKSQ